MHACKCGSTDEAGSVIFTRKSDDERRDGDEALVQFGGLRLCRHNAKFSETQFIARFRIEVHGCVQLENGISQSCRLQGFS